MALGIYAGTSINGMSALPSPTDLQPTAELIWSENTGRAQSGANKAKMIGDVVAQKKTYAIKWGVLTQAQMTTIESKLPAGFFYFGVGATLAQAKSNARKYYRSEISSTIFIAGGDYYYKDVAVSVIEQ